MTQREGETQEQKMCRLYRKFQLNIADHLGDHRRALLDPTLRPPRPLFSSSAAVLLRHPNLAS